VPIGAPKSLTACRRVFERPTHPRHRQYEALRAYFLEARPSQTVARTFGYTPGSFRVLCHAFRRDPEPQFFASPSPGPPTQPKKSKARDLIVGLRKQNHSVYEIAAALTERRIALSPTAVREVLREEGFAPLPRRLDEERPAHLGPTIEPVADVREFVLEAGRRFTTRCGGPRSTPQNRPYVDGSKPANEVGGVETGGVTTASGPPAASRGWWSGSRRWKNPPVCVRRVSRLVAGARP
jgi:transposase